jgi:hypothetical protein
MNASSNGSVRAATQDTTANDAMQVVHVFAKNRFDEVRTYIQPFKRYDLAHIRIFTLGDDDEMHPTRQGVAVKLSDLPKLAEAVAALVSAVEARQS